LGSLINYIIRRVLFMIPVFIGVTLFTFLIGNAAGNPINLIRLAFKGTLPQNVYLQLVAYYHIGENPLIRYLYYLWDLIHFDLGLSITSQRPVASEIGPWVWTTLYLQLSALALALLIGIPIAIYSARHQHSKSDTTITGIAIFGYSTPTFWLGIIFIYIFSFYLRVLPSSGAVSAITPWWGNWTLDRIAHLILPMTVLTYVQLATIIRLLRGNLLEVLKQDYILAAMASGLKERAVIYGHALRNAITPIITIIGLSLGASLAGAPGLETAFSWPGLGYEFTQAALALDIPTVLGITVIISVMVLVANLATDLVYGFLDPRVRVS